MFRLVGGLLCTVSVFSQAGLITPYTSRDAFETAAGDLVTETFNQFQTEEAFHTLPLDVGDFTLSISGEVNGFRNYIDIPPLDFSFYNVDGSAVANILTFDGVSLLVSFADPVTAFGADFRAFQDSISRTDIVVDNQLLTPPVDLEFYGFTSTTPFRLVEFRGRIGDGFSMDNVSYSAAPPATVAEPAAVLLLAAGLTLLAGMRFHRHLPKPA